MPELAFTSHGAGPCLVLLHAFPLDGRLWRAQVGELSASHRLVIPDLRGFGRSRDLGPPSSIAQMADDVASLLASLGVARARVLGLSMGGYVALALLQKYPTIVEQLVLCDTRADADSPEARQGRARQLALLHGGAGVAGLFEQLLPRLVGPATGDAVRESLRQVAMDQSIKSVSGAVVALRDRPDQSATLEGCQAPVLVVNGAADAISTPDDGRALAALAPRGTFLEIPGAGHLSCIENPDIFNREVARWLAFDVGG